MEEIKLRRWRWIEHVLHIENESIPKRAICWTPDGKRRVGWPRNTRRRTVEKEMKELKVTWKEIRW